MGDRSFPATGQSCAKLGHWFSSTTSNQHTKWWMDGLDRRETRDVKGMMGEDSDPIAFCQYTIL